MEFLRASLEVEQLSETEEDAASTNYCYAL